MTRLLHAVLLLAVAHAAAAQPNAALLQSPGVNQPADIDVWRGQENRGGLRPEPPAPPGAPNPPGGLFQFGGSGTTSFATPDLGMPFSAWRRHMEQQRPQVDQAARQRLEARFALQCRPHPSGHVNGHANGAIALAPDSRPNYVRLRVDTPTMRGNYAEIVLSSKRSIRTMDHFADNTRHDLKVERFYAGRPEGPITTFRCAASGTRRPSSLSDLR